MRKQFRGIMMYFFFFLMVFWIFGKFTDYKEADSVYSYTKFVEAVDAGQVVSAKISQNKEVPTGTVVFQLKDGAEKTTNLSDVGQAANLMQENGVDVSYGKVEKESNWVSLLSAFSPVIMVVFLFMMMNRQPGGG